jgi:CheY-like chemotaxis protein
MTELLLETQLDEEQREYANQVKFSAEVLLGLINDILDFSKIEAGKLSLEVIEFDLYTTVEEAVDMVSLEAHKKGLDVVVYLDPALPRVVYGDAVRLRQIIVNLFNNAVKFTSEGHVAFRATAVPTDQGSGNGDGRTRRSILFEVIDSGIGIPHDKLTKLFTAFSQVDSSTTRKYGGTGLGLSICRSLVHLMGGKIGVRSQYGRGSTFWYTVPFSVKTDADAAKDDLNGLAEGRRVLLVDDNAVARRAVRSYLEWWGFVVEEAASGEDALGRLKSAAGTSESFELALVDLSMHGMDGWQVASEINADKSINSTKLILMSPTGTMAGEAKMKLLRWFNAYANKPVKWHDLREALSAALRSDLDLDEADDEQVSDLEPVEEEVPESEAPGEGGRVLIAEDHFVNQQLFKTILEKRGYEVILANNGSEAVDLVRSEAPDIVFMDVHMPVMNGYEATTKIREIAPELPIVAVTANAVKGEADKCLEVGMNDYLTKPFKSADLEPLLLKHVPKRDGTTRNAMAESDESNEGEQDPEGHDPTGHDPEGQDLENDAPVFDYDEAVDAFMGKKDVVARVVSGFVERVETQLETLEQLVEQEEMESARNEAHSIKGGAWNLSAGRLGNAAASMEEACSEGDTARARRELPGVKTAFDEFREYCRSEVGLF